MLIDPKREATEVVPELAKAASSVNDALDAIGAALHNVQSDDTEQELRTLRHNLQASIGEIQAMAERLSHYGEGT